MGDLTNHYFFLKKVSRRQYKISTNPWIIRDILPSIKTENNPYAKYLKNKSPEILSKCKKYRNELTRGKKIATLSIYF